MDLVNVLTTRFNAGASYSAIASVRSVVSTMTSLWEGARLGEHPLVMRAMAAIRRNRPPKAAYEEFFEPTVVFQHMDGWGALASITLEQLTRKLVTQAELQCFARSADIAAIWTSKIVKDAQGRWTWRYFSPKHVRGRVLDWRSARPADFGPAKVLDDCAAEVRARDSLSALVQEYLRRTEERRAINTAAALDAQPGLVLTTKVRGGVFRPLTAQRIAKLVKETIQAAGVGAEYSAHSCRGAGSTAALASQDRATVRERMSLGSESVFATHYAREQRAKRRRTAAATATTTE